MFGTQMAVVCQKHIVCDSSSPAFSSLSQSTKSSLKQPSFSNISRPQMTKKHSISQVSTRTKDSKVQHVSTTSTASIDIRTIGNNSTQKDEIIAANSSFAEFIVQNLK